MVKNLIIIIFHFQFIIGIILYTFLHFDSTPAILTAIVIGVAIVVGGCAVVHNVLLWFKVYVDFVLHFLIV